MQAQEWNTLLVEDNEDDAFIIQRAFKTAGIVTHMVRCKDGKSALDYFEGEDGYRDRNLFPLPDLLILDLKMPLRSGLEVLRWLRSHPDFQSQIVVILTSSAEFRDVEEANRLHANAYLVKPSSLDGMIELARCIQTCWLNEPLRTLHRPAPNNSGGQPASITRSRT
jgi:CheY-like chemotaxis protein